MSWLFSQVLVEEYLGENFSDGEPSVPLNGNPTQLAYLSQDKMTVFSRLSRFGMTFKPLTGSRGEELLTLYLEDFHARTLVQQEGEQELTESDQECGEKWRGSFTKYSPDSHSWKTHQCSLLGDLEPFLETWPRWGLMRDGECWEQPTLEQTIRGTESGSLQEIWPTPRSCSAMAARITPESAWNEKRNPNLETIVGRVMWPTPTCHNAKEAGYPAEFNRKTPTLAATVAMRKFPTPQASDNRDRGNLSSGATQRRMEKGKQISLSQSVSHTSGALNPMWVEWLMGWPLGWTDLNPLETDKSHYVQQQLGES